MDDSDLGKKLYFKVDFSLCFWKKKPNGLNVFFYESHSRSTITNRILRNKHASSF